jgi:hypothetical protein
MAGTVTAKGLAARRKPARPWQFGRAATGALMAALELLGAVDNSRGPANALEDAAMLRYLLACTLIALAALPVTTAQERPAADAKRGAYVVKFGAAKNLAGILAKQFKGAAEIQAGPEGTSNCLLVNAPPAVFDEVMKTIELLDRRPHSVAVEVFVIELPARKGDDKDKPRPDDKEFSGTINDVAARLEAMLKAGEVAGFKRIEFTSLEGQLASLIMNENKPFEVANNTFSYRNFGTQVQATPLVNADGSILLEVKVSDGRIRESTTAPGKPEFVSTALTERISVASGKAVVAQNTRVNAKEGNGEMIVVVGARVVEPEAKRK